MTLARWSRLTTLLGALLVPTLVGCGKTCPRTWSRIKKCAGEGAPTAVDQDAEQAFRQQCKKLDKARLKRCLDKDDCPAFQRCLGRATRMAAGQGNLCTRVYAKALACEKSKDRVPKLDDTQQRQEFDARCAQVEPSVLERCLRETDCEDFERCGKRAFKGLKRHKRAEPDPTE
jgi:hypothetical protein